MPKGVKGSKKDKFADLPEEFRDAVAGESIEEIKKRISKVALDQAAFDEAMEKDEHLQQAKEQAKEAGAGYAEAKKANRLRIQFCRQVLGDKGVDVSHHSKK